MSVIETLKQAAWDNAARIDRARDVVDRQHREFVRVRETLELATKQMDECIDHATNIATLLREAGVTFPVVLVEDPYDPKNLVMDADGHTEWVDREMSNEEVIEMHKKAAHSLYPEYNPTVTKEDDPESPEHVDIETKDEPSHLTPEEQALGLDGK